MQSILAAILLILLCCCPTWAYRYLDKHVLQSDGSAADTQAAINAAVDGTIIKIPNGSYSWGQQVTNAKHTAIHLIAQSIGGVTITRSYRGDHLILLNACRNGYAEISGINFNDPYAGGDVNYTVCVNVNQLTGRPVLIHDCSFVNSSANGYDYMLRFVGNGGVVWNCSFATKSDALNGITFVNNSSTNALWNVIGSMGAGPDRTGLNNGDPSGTLDTYVENCLFQDMYLYCTDFGDNSRVVVRYSTFNNASLGSHGQDTGPWGTRHWEIYNNTFSYSSSGTAFGGHPYPLNMNAWFIVRGGTGVVANNAMEEIPYNKSGIQLNVYSINRKSFAIPGQTAYPAARQPGRGWSPTSKAKYGTPVVPQDGIGDVLDPIYIWGNSGPETNDPGYVGLNQYIPDECGNGERIEDFLKEGRDYFVNVPRPGWKPYTYPHPLREKALGATGRDPLAFPGASSKAADATGAPAAAQVGKSAGR